MSNDTDKIKYKTIFHICKIERLIKRIQKVSTLKHTNSLNMFSKQKEMNIKSGIKTNSSDVKGKHALTS